MEEKVNEFRRKKAPLDAAGVGTGAAGGQAAEALLITGFSEITSASNLRKILSSFPSEHSQWRLAYSQSQHGSSFPYFFRVCGDSEQSVVLLKSEKGRIFGGFCATHWEDRIHTLSPSFYGDRDCSVWRLTEEKQQPNGQRAASPPLSSLSLGGRQSPVHVPGLTHASTEPLSPHALDPSTSLLMPSSQASSIVMDTMLKATHAVEVASAAGLDVAPAVRRASIDTTAMSLGGAGGGASGQSLGSGASGAGGGGADGETMEVPHIPSTLEIFGASGLNSNFMFSSPDLIAMGGRSSASLSDASSASSNAGGFAWSIDRDFREGSSSECDTYRSPVLAEGVDWQCAKMEVWVPVVAIGFRSTAAAAGAAAGAGGAAGGDDGSLTISSPVMNISVTPPTAGSPPQAVSP